MAENTEKTVEEQNDKPWQWKKGQSGNPNGRPKGSISIKTKVKQYFEDNPDKFDEFIGALVSEHRGLVWQMLEGKPPQDLNLGQNPELPFTINITKHDGRENKNS